VSEIVTQSASVLPSSERSARVTFREYNTVRLIAFALAAFCHLQPGLTFAQDTAGQLAGSWKLNSWTIQIIDGDLMEPFGPNPKGRAVFTPDGYVTFVIVAANRKPATNNDESAALLKSLLAYTGKFSTEGDKFTTKVDISWNELFTGQDQMRFFKAAPYIRAKK
jgi:lipocalin-like protein